MNTQNSIVASLSSTLHIHPFGMQMPLRSYTGESYRFGFNGMEKDDEVAGQGNSYTAEYWQYDSRLGRRWNTDPKWGVVPFETPYSFSFNMPIIGNDPDGDLCIPCVVIIAGLITAPAVAVAPTGQKEDKQKIDDAYSLQGKWIFYSITAGGITSSALGTQFLKELGKQFLITGVANGAIEGFSALSNNRKYDFINNVLFETLNNLDYADAYLAKFNFGKVTNVILAAAIDLTPEEASILGLNKDVGNLTIDAVFGAISELSENTIAKGKYSKVIRKVFTQIKDASVEAISKEIKNIEKNNNANEFINNISNQNFDKVNVLPSDGNQNYIPKCLDCEK